MPQGTTEVAGGNWLNVAKDSRNREAQKDAAALAVPAIVSGGNAKPVETAKPETQASATVETVLPKKEEVAEAVVTKTSEPRVVKVTDKSTLIEIPGEKPKTAENLKFELEQGRRMQKREAEISERERKLQVAMETQILQPKTVETVAAPVLQKPAPPANAVDGEPEYEEYKAKLTAFENAKTFAPVLERLVRIEERQTQEQQAKADAEANIASNRKSYEDALTNELPFDLEGLPEETQKEVFNRIRQAGLARGVDIADRDHMRKRAISVSEMGLYIARAFPYGSRPPGYEDVQASEELLKLAETTGPLVEKPKPDPLPATGTGAVAVNTTTESDKPKGPVSWRDKSIEFSKPNP